MGPIKIRIKLLNQRCNVLVQRDDDVGADVQSMVSPLCVINPGKTDRIPLGFAIEIPVGYSGHVLPRPGLPLKGRVVWSPPVDHSYRGEVHAIVHNASAWPWVINLGDRIAQLVILPAPRITFTTCTELSATARNDKGFGSSGIKPLGVDANDSSVRTGGNGG